MFLFEEFIYESDGSIVELSPEEKTIVNKPAPASSITITPKTLELIKHFESAHDGNKLKPHLQPKMDPIGIWTVGYGTALRHPNGAYMRYEKDRKAAENHKYGNMTIAQADQLLIQELQTKYMPEVYKMVSAWRFNNDQLGALCSFVYNCGTHYRNKAGKLVPYAIFNNVTKMTAAQLKAYWESSVIRGGGKVLPGLIRRRKSEYHLFDKGALKFNF